MTRAARLELWSRLGFGRASPAGPLLPRRHSGQFVGAVVVVVGGVAFGPGPGGFVAADGFIQLAPEVAVHHRLSGAGDPALALPAVDPLGDAVLHVLGIGNHFDLAGLL